MLGSTITRAAPMATTAPMGSVIHGDRPRSVAAMPMAYPPMAMMASWPKFQMPHMPMVRFQLCVMRQEDESAD
jgi:hypothetical protein